MGCSDMAPTLPSPSEEAETSPKRLLAQIGLGLGQSLLSSYGRTLMPGGTELVVVLVIVALLFGGSKLPKLARSLGSAKG